MSATHQSRIPPQAKHPRATFTSTSPFSSLHEHLGWHFFLQHASDHSESYWGLWSILLSRRVKRDLTPLITQKTLADGSQVWMVLPRIIVWLSLLILPTHQAMMHFPLHLFAILEMLHGFSSSMMGFRKKLGIETDAKLML